MRDVFLKLQHIGLRTYGSFPRVEILTKLSVTPLDSLAAPFQWRS